MQQPQATLAINPQHVIQQFRRRQNLEPARFMLDEVAERMLSRLSIIKLEPQAILDAGCGLGQGMRALQTHYPKAALIGLDNQADFLAQAAQDLSPDPKGFERMKNLLARVGSQKRSASPKPEFVEADLAASTLDPNSVDFVWSNMALHWHPDPPKVFKEWFRVLSVDGLLMFSCFGPSTLIELRAAIQAAGWQTQTMAFVDMHDYGDMLMASGFKDPVMDQDILTLTYKTPEKLLADVYALGGNPSSQRYPALRGRGALARLHRALEEQRGDDGLIRLSFEVINGHAWRGASLNMDGVTHVAISSIGRR